MLGTLLVLVALVMYAEVDLGGLHRTTVLSLRGHMQVHPKS